MIRDAIRLLADNHPIDRDQAYETLSEIMRGEATPAQIAAFITALRIRGETPEVIAGCAQVMREHLTAIVTNIPNTVDTCGTGGDASGTFNISTTAAFVTAGAGVSVAKHGNKSVSSKSGSADVLDALGVNIGVSPEVMTRCLQEVGIAFLFAPALHPAMKHAIGPRKEIGIRTIFNILGPLSNPAGARRGVLGVYSDDLVPVMAEASAALGAEHLFVVHGSDGLDELTTTGSTAVAEITGDGIQQYTLTPQELNIPQASLEDLRGGDPAENAAIVRAVLSGEEGPRRDIVLLNAAAAITASGNTDSLQEGLKAAAQSIDSGQALNKLNALIQAAQ